MTDHYRVSITVATLSLTQYSHSTHVDNEIDPHKKHGSNSNLPLPISWTKTLPVEHCCEYDGRDEERYFYPGVEVSKKDVQLANKSHYLQYESNTRVDDDNYGCSRDKVGVDSTQTCNFD